MSIKAYVGRMGSGKTYEVVSEVIVGALRRGRRVVSNIAGLDYDAIRAMLEVEGIPVEHVGTLVQIEHVDVLTPNFWRTDKDTEQGIEAFIQPGDLVALDEIWRFWDGFADRKMPDRVMNFYRMHRHFTHAETGLACDVALITQDVLDISRKVRAVVEETYYMEKLTAIGSTRRYRVDIFQGTRTSRRPLRQLQKVYDNRYFPLYSSHSQKKDGDADAREENIDGRGNILKGALFKIVLPLGFLVVIAGVYFVQSFFHPKPKDKDKAGVVATAGTSQPGQVSQAKRGPAVSDDWRILGYYDNGTGPAFYLSNGERIRVLHNPPAYKFSGSGVEAFLPSGEAVTNWSGPRSGGGLMPGQTK